MDTTIITMDELKHRIKAENVEFSERLEVIKPRWAESEGGYEWRRPGTDVKSALMKPALLVRSDGSFVFLDGMMAVDELAAAEKYRIGALSWQDRGMFWDTAKRR